LEGAGATSSGVQHDGGNKKLRGKNRKRKPWNRAEGEKGKLNHQREKPCRMK